MLLKPIAKSTSRHRHHHYVCPPSRTAARAIQPIKTMAADGRWLVRSRRRIPRTHTYTYSIEEAALPVCQLILVGCWLQARRSNRLDAKVKSDQREDEALDVLHEVVEDAQAFRVLTFLHI